MRRLALAVLFVAACSQPAAYRPARDTLPPRATPADAIEAARRVMERRGHAVRGEEDGALLGEWVEVSVSLGRYRHAWRVTAAETGITVEIDCEKASRRDDPVTWGPCGRDRASEWVAEAESLIIDLRKETSRVAGGR